MFVPIILFFKQTQCFFFNLYQIFFVVLQFVVYFCFFMFKNGMYHDNVIHYNLIKNMLIEKQLSINILYKTNANRKYKLWYLNTMFMRLCTKKLKTLK